MISVRRSIALSSAAALLLGRATVSASAASAGPPPAGRCHPPHAPGRAYARGDRASSSSSPRNTAEHNYYVACSPPGVGDCTASGSRSTRVDDDVDDVKYNYLCDSDACDTRPGGTNAYPPGLAATTWTLEGDGPCSVSLVYSRCA
jgi:hypothetical protein